MDRAWEGQREWREEAEGMTHSWQTPDVCGAPVLPSGSYSLILGRAYHILPTYLKVFFFFFSELERSSLSFAYSDWEKCNCLSHLE